MALLCCWLLCLVGTVSTGGGVDASFGSFACGSGLHHHGVVENLHYGGGIIVAKVFVVRVFVRQRRLVVHHAAATGHGERRTAVEVDNSAALTAGVGMHGQLDDSLHAGTMEWGGAIISGLLCFFLLCLYQTTREDHLELMETWQSRIS